MLRTTEIRASDRQALEEVLARKLPIKARISAIVPSEFEVDDNGKGRVTSYIVVVDE
jgi:hypothetical protein